MNLKLREEIINLLNNQPIKTYFKLIQLSHNNLEGLDASELILLCIPFINAKFLDSKNEKEESKREYENFIFYIDDLNLDHQDDILRKDFAKLSEISKHCEISRNNKIFMYHIKKTFRWDFVDWDNKNWMLSLLSYFYVLSIEAINYLKIEMSFTEQIKEEKKLNINILNRKDLLRNRIQPKYTLYQFADKLLRQINEKQEDIKNKTALTEEEEKNDNKLTIEEIREKDEINDERHNTRGHTTNIG